MDNYSDLPEMKFDRGFTDMAKGYSFWDGYGTSEFVIGSAGNYEDVAKAYNASLSAESNDALLKC